MKTFRIHPAVLAFLVLWGASSAASQEECAQPGKDGEFNGGGVVNTYFRPVLGAIPAGAKEIVIDSAPVSGPAIPLSSGDMILVIQMQYANFNANNDARYGDGVDGGPGSGATLIEDADGAGAGKYEFARVDAVAADSPSSGLTTLTVTSKGSDGGLINPYVSADYDEASHGQRRYQVIRVPQYTDATITSSLIPSYWDPVAGTGGVVTIDVRDTLTFDGNITHVDASGRGFRGAGAFRVFGDGDDTNNSDYVQPSSFQAHGNKGGGICGSPRYTYNPSTGLVEDSGVDGYPGGVRAQGAPGTAGGGGNSGTPDNNGDESGGGGGANVGDGGKGGYTSNSYLNVGGEGGRAFVLPPGHPDGGAPAWSVLRIIMGGGGGSGVQDDSSSKAPHGNSGGGIVILRTNLASGAGLISADGNDAPDTGNDGGGGAGAGGSVILYACSGDWSGVTVNARGGQGADAGTGTSVLGPGGGGGGGCVIASSEPVTDTSGGANGTTDGGSESLGATLGVVGVEPPGSDSNGLIGPGEIPGIDSGADCNNNDLPYAEDDSAGTDLDVPVTIDVLDNDWDPDGDTFLLFTVQNPTAQGGMAVLNAGKIDYTPPAGWSGTDTFVYTIKEDATAEMHQDDAVVTVRVNQNDPPVITVPGAQTVNEDAALAFPGTISVDDPDADPDDLQVILSVDHGILTLATVVGLSALSGDGTGSVSFEGTLDEINDALNGLQYLPPDDFTSPPAVTLAISVDDLGHNGPDGAKQDTEVVSVAVLPINDAPVAVNDVYVVDGTAPFNPGGSGVLANDGDIEADTLEADLVSGPAHGTLVLNSNGSFVYTSDYGFQGGDTFTYVARDIHGATSAPATVFLTVYLEEKKASYCNGSASDTASGGRIWIPLLAAFGFWLLAGMRRYA